MDPLNRVIYVIDRYGFKLIRYDIDAQTVEVVGDTPIGATDNQPRVAWDLWLPWCEIQVSPRTC